MKCSWCQKREVEFELAVYYLRKETETVANKIGDKKEQLLRNGMYLKVHLCEKCLPCTAVTKLRKNELSKT